MVSCLTRPMGGLPVRWSCAAPTVVSRSAPRRSWLIRSARNCGAPGEEELKVIRKAQKNLKDRWNGPDAEMTWTDLMTVNKVRCATATETEWVPNQRPVKEKQRRERVRRLVQVRFRLPHRLLLLRPKLMSTRFR